MNRAEHQAVVRVLNMVDEVIAAQPADTLTASTSGGLMTWGEIRRHIAGAVCIMESNVPRESKAPRPAWPGGRSGRRSRR